MPFDPYMSVTLRKEVIEKLRMISPNEPVSKSVTGAIAEYIEKRNPKAFKPFDIEGWILRHTTAAGGKP